MKARAALFQEWIFAIAFSLYALFVAPWILELQDSFMSEGETVPIMGWLTLALLLIESPVVILRYRDAVHAARGDSEEKYEAPGLVWFLWLGRMMVQAILVMIAADALGWSETVSGAMMPVVVIKELVIGGIMLSS